MNKRLWLIMGLALLVALVAVCGAALLVARGYLERSGQSLTEVLTDPRLQITEEPAFHFVSSETFQLSDQQQVVVDDFGWPHSFTIIEAEDPDGASVRYEIWNYYVGATAYTFLDGEFQYTELVEPLEGDLILTPYHPDQFMLGMTSETLQATLSGREWVSMPGADFFREGVDIFVNQQLVTGFYENRLIYIEAYGFEKEGGGS
jgi:hypothetical protein